MVGGVAVARLDINDLVRVDLPVRAGENLVDTPQRDPVKLVGRPGSLCRQGSRRFQAGLGKEATTERLLGGVEVTGEQYRLGGISLRDLVENDLDCPSAAPLRQIKVCIVDPERAAGAPIAQADPRADAFGTREPPEFRARRAIGWLLEPERALVDFPEPVAIEEDCAVFAAGRTIIAADTDPEIARHRAFQETELLLARLLHAKDIRANRSQRGGQGVFPDRPAPTRPGQFSIAATENVPGDYPNPLRVPLQRRWLPTRTHFGPRDESQPAQHEKRQ